MAKVISNTNPRVRFLDNPGNLLVAACMREDGDADVIACVNLEYYDAHLLPREKILNPKNMFVAMLTSAHPQADLYTTLETYVDVISIPEKAIMKEFATATLSAEIEDLRNFQTCMMYAEEGKILNKKGPGHRARNTAPLEPIVVENETDALCHFRLKGYCAIYYKTKIGYVVVEGTKTKKSFEWRVYFDLIKPMSLRVDLYSFIDATLTDKDNALSFFIGDRNQLPINNIIHRVDKWFTK